MKLILKPLKNIKLGMSQFSGLLVFVFVFGLTTYLSYQRYLILKSSEENELRRQASQVENEIKRILEQGFSSTQNLAFLTENYGVPEDFPKVAKLILGTNSNIDALELVDSTGLITNVYPFEGNEVLGFNILKDSIGKEGALKTMEKGGYYVTGPINLKQGGSGFVCRTPIYVENQFAGFAAAVIKLESLLSEISLKSLENNPFSYQLYKTNTDGSEQIFYATKEVFSNNAMKHFISDYNGEWKLYVISEKKLALYGFYVLGGLGLILSIIAGVFTTFLLEQPRTLRKMVNEKTHLLQENEQKLRAFIAQASDGIFLADFHGNLLEANIKGVELFGYPKEELLTKNLVELATKSDLKKAPLRFKEINKGHSVLTERKLLRKDGSSFYGEVSAKKLNDGTILGIVRDVTARKKLEYAANENLKKFQKAFNSQTIGMAIFDNELKFADANQYFLELLGFQLKEVIGKKFKELGIIIDEESKRKEALDSLNSSGKILSMELIARPKGKEKIFFTASAETYEVNKKKYILATYLDRTDERKAQKKIVASEKKYRELTERISDAFISIDNHWNLTYVNAKAQELIQKKKEELIGKNIWDVFKNTISSSTRGKIEGALKKQEYVHLEQFHPRNNIWIESHVYPSPEGLTVYFRDITQRKVSEEENQKLLAVIEKSPGFIGLSGMDGGGIYLNESGRELVGLSNEDAISNYSILDFFPEDSRQVIKEEYMPIIFKNGSWSGEGYLKSFKENRNIPAALSAFLINDKNNNKPIGIGSVAFDLTDQKKTEREILELQNKMNAAIRIGKIGYWNWNFEKDIIDWSERMYEIYDVEPGRKIDVAFTKTLIHPDDLVMHDTIIDTKISQRDNSSFSYRIIHRDKSIKYVKVQMEVTTDASGKVIASQGTAVDITEAKEFEKRLENQNAELKKTNSELDSFVYSASHELRAPLASLMGLLDIMKKEKGEPETINRLEMMENSVMRLDAFIEDIISYSRNKHMSLKCEKVNFKEIIDKALQDLWYLKNTKKIHISTNLKTDCEFFSDRRSIAVLISNFLSNAIKYNDKTKTTPSIWIDVNTNEEKAVIEIKDNGIGIKKKSQEKIYDMFYRDSSDEMGSGIGLFIVKEIINKLDGTIELDSKPKIGTTFTLTLPNTYPNN
ncbi:PAS domain S-box protein [Maribacter flavus]|uniref:histidine kinase n=1 Tax=Maribacter flavus TaxID=1658664 RepID=A0A5B2TXL9_9FLAO|nr:PAS domain S-box protein [Maribacter flavus]KAA2219311.1 PAS domain S-box protein [Maribacter flavus]